MKPVENSEMEDCGNFEAYTVLANRDQLERAGMWDEKEWSVHTYSNGCQLPNRVARFFGNDWKAAKELYKTLQDNRMIAFRNWLC